MESRLTTISQLNQDQRNHLAWRLNAKTHCRPLVVAAVIRGDHGDLDIVDIFKSFGKCTERLAKAHVKKIKDFVVDEKDQQVAKIAFMFSDRIRTTTKSLTSQQQIKLYKSLIENHKTFLDALEINKREHESNRNK